ncbi:hypothetical protein [Tateyamaria sp. ANG-S1]|uniref:hypothetical protein n=1 Tax=Tateyamaria sp. ANG-S1 TaxID=1577905 RepID=UPI00126A0991|nr:hypothetical protein [Tateyamaria sp. ANG-S1]
MEKFMTVTIDLEDAPYSVTRHPTPKDAREGSDYTDQVRDAINDCIAGGGGDVIFPGWVRVSGPILVGDRVRLHCPAGKDKGGLALKISDWSSEPYVLRLGNGGESQAGAALGSFGFDFEQTATTRASLKQYPEAINIDGQTFCTIENVRVAKGWNGLHGLGNFGGLRIGNLEVGCFNENIVLGDRSPGPEDYKDGARDFVFANSIHVWPFGMTNEQQAIMSGGQTYAARFGRMDNFMCDKFGTFECRIEFKSSASDSRLPWQFANLALDGNHATLLQSNGSLQIANLYTTKKPNYSGAPDFRMIGGNAQLGSVKGSTPRDGAFLIEGSARVGIGDFHVRALNGGRRALVVRGTAKAVIGALRPEYQGTRANSYACQEGSGHMYICDVAPVDDTSPSHEYVEFKSDQGGNFIDTRLVEVKFDDAWLNGFYGERNKPVLRGTVQTQGWVTATSDAAAGAAGVPIRGLYINGNQVRVRMS